MTDDKPALLDALRQWFARQSQQHPQRQLLIASVLLTVLAYGVLIPWLGLYWDDWPLTWNSHHFGAEVYQGYPPYRPLAGWVYYAAFAVLGQNLIAWHIFAVLLYWLCSLSFYWLLRIVWPPEKALAVVAGLLFLLYPGFSQHSIAVTYSVYFLYYALFLLSLALMLLSLRAHGRRRWGFALASLTLGIFTMTCTEYFYGLELLRPLLIFLVLQPNSAAKWKRTVLAWLPYVLVMAAVFAWRNWASQQSGALYRVVLLDRLIWNFGPTIVELARTMWQDLGMGAVLAWGRLVEPLLQLRSLSVSALAYLAVTGLGVGVSVFALPKVHKLPTQAAATHRSMLGLGLAALLVSGVSFWMAALPMALAFPNDRFTLPMMFGVSLLGAGLWSLLRRFGRAANVALALVLGLCVGFHFYTANQYRAEWLHLGDFARQLAWRAPSLQPNTALVSPQLRALNFHTDNSLTGLVNWMYAPAGQNTATLDYAFFYAQLRGQTRLAGLVSGEPIYAPFDFVRYDGDRSEVVLLTFAYQPPACLHLLQPEVAALLPGLSSELSPIRQLSNLNRITQAQEPFNERGLFWDFGPQQSWCYYFQKADLASQYQDWREAAQLGDTAFGLGLSPNHAAEYLPFIEAYLALGRDIDALDLTQRVHEKLPALQPLLCELWGQAGSRESSPEFLQCN